MNIHLKIIFISCINFAALFGCQNLQPKSKDIDSSTVIQQVKNIDTFPKTSKGNVATLFKDQNGFCLIEFTGFYITAEVTEHWVFNRHRLVSATTTTSYYADESIPPKDQNNKFARVESHSFDLNRPETAKNFAMLKGYFKPKNIKACASEPYLI